MLHFLIELGIIKINSMNEKHEKDLILSSGFNNLKKCRYGIVLYNHNDMYVGKSFDCYGEGDTPWVNLHSRPPSIRRLFILRRILRRMGTHEQARRTCPLG